MQHTDRFAPESYEDFLCRGKTSRECAEIRDRLNRAEREPSEDDRDELARLQMRDAERESVNGGDE